MWAATKPGVVEAGRDASRSECSCMWERHSRDLTWVVPGVQNTCDCTPDPDGDHDSDDMIV